MEPTKKSFRRFITQCGSVFSVISQKLVFEIGISEFVSVISVLSVVVSDVSEDSVTVVAEGAVVVSGLYGTAHDVKVMTNDIVATARKSFLFILIPDDYLPVILL